MLKTIYFADLTHCGTILMIQFIEVFGEIYIFAWRDNYHAQLVLASYAAGTLRNNEEAENIK